MKTDNESKAKIFILDTNVLLHDHQCLFNFQENDIVIPIVVLEELDQFKKGNEQINFQAREFVRQLDKIAGEQLFTDGVSLGQTKGRLFIMTGKPFPKIMLDSFGEQNSDNKILSIALFIKEKYPKRNIVLISKDINLRMKAKSLGLNAEDYETDKVKNIDVLHKSVDTWDDVSVNIIETVYQDGIFDLSNKTDFLEKLISNQYLVLRNGSQSVLTRFNSSSNQLIRIEKRNAYGIEPRNSEQTFALNALLNPDIKLVSLTGKAGTGKTLLALAAALQQHKTYKEILLARPIMPLTNQDLGFLPGDIKEKVAPYMMPLYDNLSVIKNRFSAGSRELITIENMQKNNELTITPLAYIRGRSLSNIYFIIDEAQNLTPHEVKTIITRAGEGTKMVFTGDVHQIDSPYLDMQSNGLAYLTDKMKGQDIFAHVNLVKGERSYLADLASNLL